MEKSVHVMGFLLAFFFFFLRILCFCGLSRNGKKEQNCKICAAAWLGTAVKCLSIVSHKLKKTWTLFSPKSFNFSNSFSQGGFFFSP